MINQLECPFCNENFNKENRIPHETFQCQHPICSECLNRYLEFSNEKFICPKDGNLISIKNKTVASFPINYKLLEKLENLKEDKQLGKNFKMEEFGKSLTKNFKVGNFEKEDRKILKTKLQNTISNSFFLVDFDDNIEKSIEKNDIFIDLYEKKIEENCDKKKKKQRKKSKEKISQKKKNSVVKKKKNSVVEKKKNFFVKNFVNSEKCKMHKKVLELICTQCKVLVCYDCAFFGGKHENHKKIFKIQEILEENDKKLKNLKEIMINLLKNEEFLTKYFFQNETLPLINQREKDNTDDIDKFYERVISHLKEQKLKLKNLNKKNFSDFRNKFNQTIKTSFNFQDDLKKWKKNKSIINSYQIQNIAERALFYIEEESKKQLLINKGNKLINKFEKLIKDLKKKVNNYFKQLTIKKNFNFSKNILKIENPLNALDVSLLNTSSFLNTVNSFNNEKYEKNSKENFETSQSEKNYFDFVDSKIIKQKSQFFRHKNFKKKNLFKQRSINENFNSQTSRKMKSYNFKLEKSINNLNSNEESILNINQKKILFVSQTPKKRNRSFLKYNYKYNHKKNENKMIENNKNINNRRKIRNKNSNNFYLPTKISKLKLKSKTKKYQKYLNSLLKGKDKGIYLDLKNHQIENLNLNKKGLDENHINALVPFFLKNYKLKNIVLKGNKISDKGVEVLKDIFFDLKISSLDLSSNKIKDKGAEYIFNLCKTNRNIKEINLKKNDGIKNKESIRKMFLNIEVSIFI